jgi:hypothetical protein
MARTAGVATIVTDGLARDSTGTIEVGVPVFASGISPTRRLGPGPGTVGLSVTISGVQIAPGGVMVGDGDGVVVVHREQFDSVYEQLESVRTAAASYPTGANGEVEVPGFVHTLLASCVRTGSLSRLTRRGTPAGFSISPAAHLNCDDKPRSWEECHAIAFVEGEWWS